MRTSAVSPADGERLSQLERQARRYFMVALQSGVEATLEETKRRGLGHISIDVIAGIMHRALDEVRAQWRWL